MEGRCERHLFDRAIDRCGRCGLEFCHTCVIYPFGNRKPPFCLPCAVEAAGVRSGAGSGRALSRRERKQLERERRDGDLVGARGATRMPTPEEKFDMDWLKAPTAPSH
jgi:hypothetical protein